MVVQWGSEYRQPFEYQKHLNTKISEVRISNGLISKCIRLTIQILDQYIRKQNGIHLSGTQWLVCPVIQLAFKYQTIWHLTSFRVQYSDPHF